jgi:hypothetical protein
VRRVHIAANPVEAEVAKLHLESKGIPAVVRNDHIWPIAGLSMTVDGAPAVWVVRDGDEDLARRVLAERDSAISSLPDWRCKRCGEDNEGAFGICWKCGAPADPLPD